MTEHHCFLCFRGLIPGSTALDDPDLDRLENIVNDLDEFESMENGEALFEIAQANPVHVCERCCREKEGLLNVRLLIYWQNLLREKGFTDGRRG